MTKPYYNVGEEVYLVGYGGVQGEYTVLGSYSSDPYGQYYLLEGLMPRVYEDELRKKYTPSTKSFDEMMYDLQ